MLVVNFKAYREGTGNRAVKLAKAIGKARGRNIVLAVQPADIGKISGIMPVFAFANAGEPDSHWII